MELSASYAYRVFQCGSFSAAAKALYISQPSLSATIARLENELGFKIFYRDTSPISLTPEGHIYIDTLEEIIECENVMKTRLERLATSEGGTLSVGPANNSSYIVLAKAMRRFYEVHPNIQITVDLGSSHQGGSIMQKLQRHELDMMLSYAYNPKIFDASPILREQLVFAAHRETKGVEQIAEKAISWEKIATASYTEEEKIDDFSVIRELPFIAFSPETATGKSMHEIMGSFKKSSHAVTNFKDLSFHYIAMYAGVTPLLLPDIVISQHKTGDDILYFVPKNECSIRTVHACVKKGRERNRIADAFVDTLQEVCRSGFPLSGTHEEK